jgi:glucosamine--fructose-6-phosphate aminotransferase (isomerizing)
MRGRVNFDAGAVALPDFPFAQSEIDAIDQIVLIGMGTSLHSGMLGAYFIESLARIPARADNASEFRYRNPVVNENTLVIALTQSGETADTLAAMEEAAIHGARRLAIVETDGTQATRMARGTLLVRAGQEIGVASTKTMTNTVVTLYLLAIHLAKMRGEISTSQEQAAAAELSTLPGKLSRLLENSTQYTEIAAGLTGKQHLLYLGRGGMFPAAMEGALKMKEIAYIHAEGYAAGEMKHGPIALISDAMPIIALAPAGPLQEKMISNINEVKTRGGDVIAIATEGDSIIERIADDTLFLPQADEAFSSILALIPMQLLAYHTAVALELDPDKPRNLAKTVTVE